MLHLQAAHQRRAANLAMTLITLQLATEVPTHDYAESAGAALEREVVCQVCAGRSSKPACGSTQDPTPS